MALKLGSLEFYTGPTVLGGPDDLDAVIRGFIDGTRHALNVAVQELDSEPIARAILAAKARKIPRRNHRSRVDRIDELHPHRHRHQPAHRTCPIPRQQPQPRRHP
jgi:hypothetical protein